MEAAIQEKNCAATKRMKFDLLRRKNTAPAAPTSSLDLGSGGLVVVDSVCVFYWRCPLCLGRERGPASQSFWRLADTSQPRV